MHNRRAQLGGKPITQITEFDITEHIRNKVRAVLIESIPDAQMDSMIQTEFNKFFKATRTSGESSFEIIVRETLRQYMMGAVTRWLEKNLETKWDNNVQSHKIVGQLVEELAPVVQQAITRDITSSVLDRIVNSVRELAERRY